MSDIRKIMEKDSAIKVLEEIKNKICDTDLDDLCGENTRIDAKDDEVSKKIIQAVMCGLVYWDDEKGCMVQRLIHPIKSGETEAKELYYKNNVTLSDANGFKASNQAGLIKESLALITARPIQLIGEIRGQDMTIATGCIRFFDR